MSVETRRPKGFVTWRPQNKTKTLMADVLKVFEEYKDHLPLTARQVFYRLVAQYDFPKTEKEYIRLCEALVRARRAGVIPFENMRDDGVMTQGTYGHQGIDGWWRTAYNSASHFRSDRSADQPVSIEVWCEASGMVPQLARVASPYNVYVHSGSQGFVSVTATHDVAQRVVRDYRPTVFLHVGDHDPSGHSIFESMAEDIATFTEQLLATKDIPNGDNPGFIYERVALTAEQVEEFNLPTAPPKASDSRTANWVGETCQAEAMAPADLAKVLDDAIRSHMDLEEYQRSLEWEEFLGFRIAKEMREHLPHRSDLFDKVDKKK